MKFTLNRHKTIVGLNGRALRFEKDVALHVPPDMHKDALAAGAVPEDDLPEDEATKTAPPLTVDERKAAVFAAFEKLILKGERESFTGSGSPHNKAVAEITGFAANAKEISKYWDEFRQLNKED